MNLTISLFVALMIFLNFSFAEDKAFKRKDITDTNKKLEIRSGGLSDTKKLLRKTDSLSNTQIAKLRQDLLKSIGKNAYAYASKNTPNLMQTRLKYGWLKMQLVTQNNDWKRREKRDAQRSGGKLTSIRAKDYKEKYSKNNAAISKYNKAMAQLDNRMKQISSNPATTNDFFENTVGDRGARLTDKLGNFVVTLHKGDKAQTKNSKLDNRYYEVKYQGQIVYTLKDYFSE